MNAMADVKVIKTAAETALAHAFREARTRLPGGDAIAAQREAAFDLFAKEGLPHRRIEDWKYTDLRALMREAKPLASPPDAAAKARAKTAGKLLGDVETRRHRLRRRRVRAGIVRSSPRWNAGLTIGSLAAALAAGDPALAAHLGKLAPGERCRRRAQYRVDGRRRGDPHRRRRDHRAAAASGLRRLGKARRDASCARWSWSSRAPASC